MLGTVYHRLLITIDYSTLATFRCSIDVINFPSFLKCDTDWVLSGCVYYRATVSDIYLVVLIIGFVMFLLCCSVLWASWMYRCWWRCSHAVWAKETLRPVSRRSVCIDCWMYSVSSSTTCGSASADSRPELAHSSATVCASHWSVLSDIIYDSF